MRGANVVAHDLDAPRCTGVSSAATLASELHPPKMSSVTNGDAQPSMIFDSLPYYDNELEQFPILKEKVERELAREGKPLYGTTSESLHNQGAAFRNSVFSQLKFGECFRTKSGVVPFLTRFPDRICTMVRSFMEAYGWQPGFVFLPNIFRFNFATHPYHGVDTSKYYEGAKPTETK